MQVSLDGDFCDARDDMSFAHKPPGDAEWHEFVAGNTVSRRRAGVWSHDVQHDGCLVACAGRRGDA
jgi:hypothetical protein